MSGAQRKPIPDDIRDLDIHSELSSRRVAAEYYEAVDFLRQTKRLKWDQISTILKDKFEFEIAAAYLSECYRKERTRRTIQANRIIGQGIEAAESIDAKEARGADKLDRVRRQMAENAKKFEKIGEGN